MSYITILILIYMIFVLETFRNHYTIGKEYIFF
jgi:hypothetical protein